MIPKMHRANADYTEMLYFNLSSTAQATRLPYATFLELFQKQYPENHGQHSYFLLHMGRICACSYRSAPLALQG